MAERRTKRHWRFYKTAAGGTPAKAFIDGLTDEDAALVYEGMDLVRKAGLTEARHLRNDIYEVRVDGRNRSYRVLFSTEGRFSQVLLAIHTLEKRTQRTPPQEIDLAENRLQDWRRRAGQRARKLH